MRKPHIRIAVTSDCNFRCKYCKDGGEGVKTEKQLTLEELICIAKLSNEVGFRHIKITGGEPLLRQKHNVDVIRYIKELSKMEFEDIQMVTNGYYLKDYAKDLIKSGLDSLTVSLDAGDRSNFKSIVEVDAFDKVIEGIQMVSDDLPVTINTVMFNENRDEIFKLIDLAQKLHANIKILDYVKFANGLSDEYKYQSFDFLYQYLEKNGYKHNLVLPPGGLGTPMKVYDVNNIKVIIKDATVGTNYNSQVCGKCDNFPCQDALISLRVTSNGMLKRCLIRNDNMVDIYSDLIKKNYKNVKEKIQESYDILINADYHENKWSCC